jgi:AcrR family transcriptional regulator
MTMTTGSEVTVAGTGQAATAAATDAPAGAPMRADARRNRERLLGAATQAFAEHGADAPLEDIAKRAGVGIGTLYRHFPTREALQESVFRSQVEAVCARGQDLADAPAPADALDAWLHALVAYLATKRGLSKALVERLGRDSELLSSCSRVMRETAAGLLERAQRAGAVRPDVSAMDIMRLIHGIAVATENAPEETDRLISLMFDGLRTTAVKPTPPAG